MCGGYIASCRAVGSSVGVGDNWGLDRARRLFSFEYQMEIGWGMMLRSHGVDCRQRCRRRELVGDRSIAAWRNLYSFLKLYLVI